MNLQSVIKVGFQVMEIKRNYGKIIDIENNLKLYLPSDTLLEKGFRKNRAKLVVRSSSSGRFWSKSVMI